MLAEPELFLVAAAVKNDAHFWGHTALVDTDVLQSEQPVHRSELAQKLTASQLKWLTHDPGMAVVVGPHLLGQAPVILPAALHVSQGRHRLEALQKSVGPQKRWAVHCGTATVGVSVGASVAGGELGETVTGAR